MDKVNMIFCFNICNIYEGESIYIDYWKLIEMYKIYILKFFILYYDVIVLFV